MVLLNLEPSFGLAMTKECEKRHHGLAEAVRDAVAASKRRWKSQTATKAQHAISRKRDLVFFFADGTSRGLVGCPQRLCEQLLGD